MISNQNKQKKTLLFRSFQWKPLIQSGFLSMLLCENYPLSQNVLIVLLRHKLVLRLMIYVPFQLIMNNLTPFYVNPFGKYYFTRTSNRLINAGEILRWNQTENSSEKRTSFSRCFNIAWMQLLHAKMMELSDFKKKIITAQASWNKLFIQRIDVECGDS